MKKVKSPSSLVQTQSAKGASIKYVRTEGEGGVQKVGKYAYDNTDRLREKCIRGGRGSKKPENLRTYLMDAP